MGEASANYTGAVVVIPTRNRPAIAVNAIRSVLDQPVDHVHVLVSDNSTSEQGRDELERFCSALGDPRLRYVRPPEPLPMSAHWEWAIQQALSLYEASHFLYLTDRMMFRTGALKEALAIAEAYPDKVISYNHDRIVDNISPIRVEQYAVTGKLLEIETLRLSWLCSQSIFTHALPRMLNSIAPRGLLGDIQDRFGSVFASIAPDFNFCFRCLEVERSILFYDRSLIFHYAQDRSHGASLSRGEMTPANADFAAQLLANDVVRNYAAPIPQLNTAINLVFHEYLVSKREAKSRRFFEVDIRKYLRINALEVRGVVDAKLRAEMFALLAANGYVELPRAIPPRLSAFLEQNGKSFSKIARAALRLPVSILRAAVTAPATKPAWLFVARRFGIGPPGQNRFTFKRIEDAIDYLKNVSHGNVRRRPYPAALLQARARPIPDGERSS